MGNAANTVISHIGICTTDAAHSIRFYTEALGFVHDRSIDEIGAPFDALTEMPGATFGAHYLTCSGVTIELIEFHNRDVQGPSERRPMNQLGFTHMTLIVDDVQAAAERVAAAGGKVHPETQIDSPFGPMVFCTDPDGVRIELIQGGN